MITLAQVSTELINRNLYKGSVESKYYDSVWKEKEKYGYVKPDDYWEIPLWIAKMSGILLNSKVAHDMVVVKDLNHKFDEYSMIAMSVLDVNKDIIEALIVNNPGVRFALGGYAGLMELNAKYINVSIYSSLEDFSLKLQLKHTDKLSYHLFNGEKCIPRLTLSTGCSFRCKFCTIRNIVKPIDREIIFQQCKEMCAHLKFDLIYIDDKTFGQCSNFVTLHEVAEFIRHYGNKNFKGFIVQTTASKAAIADYANLSVFAVEVGVESYNDEILKKYRKPATRKLIDKAVDNVVNQGIKFIPNIILGMPEENYDSYLSTYLFLSRNRKNIFLVNIYNLAIYEDAELSQTMDSSGDNSNELTSDRTYLDRDKQELCSTFSKLLFTVSSNIVRHYNTPMEVLDEYEAVSNFVYNFKVAH